MPEIGAALREARMRQKIDISEIEAETKIRAKYLRALENEEWDLLPGPTYVKSFLRTYADKLGLDGRLLVAEYRAGHERPADHEVPPLAPALGGQRRGERRADRGGGRGGGRRGPRPTGGGPRIPRALVAAILAVGVLGALFALGTLGGGNDDQSGKPAVDRQRTDTTGSRTTAKERAAARKRARERRARARARERARRRAASGGRVALSLTPTANVWVCLENASGTRLIGGRPIQPGEALPTYRSSRFRMTFGNGQVRMRIDGKDQPVAASANPIGFQVTAKGRTSLPEGRRPTCTS